MTAPSIGVIDVTGTKEEVSEEDEANEANERVKKDRTSTW